MANLAPILIFLIVAWLAQWAASKYGPLKTA